MCAYFSKAEDETSEATKQAAKEASVSGKLNFAKMRAVARTYSTKGDKGDIKCDILSNATIMVNKNISEGDFPK